MSCITCGNDDPVLATDDAAAMTCVHCRNPFASPAPPQPGLTAETRPDTRKWQPECRIDPGHVLPPRVANDDDWDDMYEPTRHRDARHPVTAVQPIHIDAGSNKPFVVGRKSNSPRRRRSTWLQWTVLTLGVCMFTCGAVLIAWSFNQDQQELWNLGAPLALAGRSHFS